MPSRNREPTSPTGEAMKPRIARARAIAKRKRREHLELVQPTLAGFMAVAQREGIEVMRHSLSPGHEGSAFELLGKPFIVLSSTFPSRRRELYVALHEYAHVALRHIYDREILEKRRAEANPRWEETEAGRWREVVEPSSVDDAIEEEADLFAEFMLAGVDIELSAVA